MTSEYILQSRVSHPDKIWEQQLFEVKQKIILNCFYCVIFTQMSYYTGFCPLVFGGHFSGRPQYFIAIIFSLDKTLC